jgi:Predicted membrane protein
MVDFIPISTFSIAVYLVLNILAFCAYGFDKTKAQMKKWRVSEQTLLILAFFGPFGGYLGMQTFRHKTQKKPFTWAVPLFILIHVALFVALVIF